MRRFLFIYFLLFSFKSYAQQGAVKGILIDSASKSKIEGIQFATISIYKEQDSAIVSFKLSDSKGAFTLKNLKLDTKYKLVVSSFEFISFRKNIVLTNEHPELNLDTIYLSRKVRELDEVQILGEQPPIIVKRDTIEFNAASFRMLPSAVVEDLVKKLPGMIVSSSGKILFNGRPVSKINVDGHEFFGGDVSIASKNLPANIVDKVQVTDDKEVVKRNPDLPLSAIPQIVNLKLKKIYKKGVFGKVYGGTNISERYESGALVNVFRDTLQLSLIGFANNLNKSAFSLDDIQRLGGFSRSGYTSLSTNGDGGFSLDKVSFGGVGNGVQNTYGGGLNFNTVTKGKTTVNGKYFFGQLNSNLIQLINDKQFFDSSTLIKSENNTSKSAIGNHSASAKIVIEPNSTTQLTFIPSLNLSPNTYNSISNQFSVDGRDSILNKSFIRDKRKSDFINFDFLADIVKEFQKPGRSLYAGINFTREVANNDNFNYSNSTYLNAHINSIIDQYRDNSIRSSFIALNGNFAEPISTSLTLTADVKINHLNKENALTTFLKNPVNENYDLVINDLTQTVNQKGFRNNARLKLQWTPARNFKIMPGIGMNAVNLNNDFSTYSDFKQSFYYFFPTLTIRYKKVSIDYTSNLREPDVRYIQPSTNNTNPLFIQLGNPKLVPTKTYRAYINYFNYNTKTSTSYNFYLNGALINDGIIIARTIDRNGIQTNLPLNANGLYELSNSGTLTKSINKSDNQVTLNAGYSVFYTNSPFQLNNERTRISTIILTPSVGIRVNLHDKLEFLESYQLESNHAEYKSSLISDRAFITHYNEAEIISRHFKKVVIETNIKSQINNQNLVSYNNSITMWNVAATFLFFDNDRGQIKVALNDLLNNNTKRSVFLIENSLRNIQSNNIGRYGIVTLIYNFQNYKPKVGGKERFLGF